MQAMTVGPYWLISGRYPGGSAAGSQVTDNKGFSSFLADNAAASATAPAARAAADPDPTNTAALAAAKLAVAAHRTWFASHFQRSSSDLIPELSNEDGAKLQALVNAGQVSWTDIRAAFDAQIKQAINERLAGQSDTLDKMPPSWQASKDAWTAYREWETAEREGRTEIYARYAEKCAALLRSDPGPADGTDTDPHAREKLMAREGILERYRQIKDRELADFTQRLGPQPPHPKMIPLGGTPYEMTLFEARSTPAETAALNKLTEAGFTTSPSLEATLKSFAQTIATNLANVATDEKAPLFAFR